MLFYYVKIALSLGMSPHAPLLPRRITLAMPMSAAATVLNLPLVRGTQSIARAATLLRAVAARPQQGWRLTDLAAHCSLDKGSAHRMLAGLVRERMITQRAGDRHYLPGPLLFELGLGVTQLGDFRARAMPALTRIARAAPGVAFLYLLSGEEFVCAARVGPSTLKGLSIEVGTRRPLAVAAGGVALLLALPERAQRAVIAANLRQIAAWGAERRHAVQTMLRRSRRAGYALNLADVVPGIHSIAVPLPDAAGRSFASLSVSGAADTLPRARLDALAEVLRREARGLAPGRSDQIQ